MDVLRAALALLVSCVGLLGQYTAERIGAFPDKVPSGGAQMMQSE